MATQRQGKRLRRTSPALPAYQPEAFLPEFDLFSSDVSLKAGRRAVDVQWGVVEELVRDPRVVQRMRGWIERGLRGRLNCYDALELVRDDLRLRWPWCAREILDAFSRMVDGIKEPVEDPEHPGTITLEVPEPHEVLGPQHQAAILAPPLMAGFWTEYGESLDEARERWAALDAAMKAEFDAAKVAAAGGRAAKGDAHLHAWGRWYYLNRVAQPPQRRSQNAIAKEFSVHRKSVDEGIKEAERLLSLGWSVFPLRKKRRS